MKCRFMRLGAGTERNLNATPDDPGEVAVSKSLYIDLLSRATKYNPSFRPLMCCAEGGLYRGIPLYEYADNMSTFIMLMIKPWPRVLLFCIPGLVRL